MEFKDENSFIKNYFSFLPNELKKNILQKIKFSPEKEYKLNTCIKNKKDKLNNFYYTQKSFIKKDQNGKFNWYYICKSRENQFKNLEIKEDDIEIVEYFDVNCTEVGCNKKIDGRSNKICNSCKNVMCLDCHIQCNLMKNSYDYRGKCNTCIWFELG